MSPSYRFPTLSYESTFSSILAEGSIKADEAKIIMEFYSLVDSINRGLDLASGVPHSDDSIRTEDHPLLVSYHERNCLKADELISLYDEVRKILDRKLKLVG